MNTKHTSLTAESFLKTHGFRTDHVNVQLCATMMELYAKEKIRQSDLLEALKDTYEHLVRIGIIDGISEELVIRIESAIKKATE